MIEADAQGEPGGVDKPDGQGHSHGLAFLCPAGACGDPLKWQQVHLCFHQPRCAQVEGRRGEVNARAVAREVRVDPFEEQPRGGDPSQGHPAQVPLPEPARPEALAAGGVQEAHDGHGRPVPLVTDVQGVDQRQRRTAGHGQRRKGKDRLDAGVGASGPPCLCRVEEDGDGCRRRQVPACQQLQDRLALVISHEWGQRQRG